LTHAALLEEAGYAVYAVSDPVEALKTITVRMPDAVILGSGGSESLALLTALRRDVSTSDVPVVVLAGTRLYSDASKQERHTGPTMLLAEPVSQDAVVAAVDDLTQSTPAERLARRQLRRSMMALRPMLHHAADSTAAASRIAGIITRLQVPMLGLNGSGSFIAASRGAEALTGFTQTELLAMSVFDATLGPHLPLAHIWDRHTPEGRSSGPAMLRDRGGRSVEVTVAIESLLPDLHVLGFVHTPR